MNPAAPTAPDPIPTRSHRIVEAEWALLPLRGFLGITFCFAGLQKLANPNFFRSSSPTSIQAQLKAAERTSPIHGLLSHLLVAGTLVGAVIALSELAIGLGVLSGILTRVAALGGIVLSFGLFLTVSFHSRPYYTGADIGYVFAFTPLLIAGGGGHLTLPALLDGLVVPGPRRLHQPELEDQRRRHILIGAISAFGLVVAGLDAGIGRLLGNAKPFRGPEPLANGPALGRTASTTMPGATSVPRPGGPSSAAASSTTGSTPAPITTKPPAGTRIGPARDVPVRGAASFQDPATGDPAIVIQPRAGRFVAFDAVCPHAGCTVQYARSQGLLVCPCHGSVFNPSTGAVEQGPAATGLRTILIAEGPNGQLYAD